MSPAPAVELINAVHSSRFSAVVSLPAPPAVGRPCISLFEGFGMVVRPPASLSSRRLCIVRANHLRRKLHKAPESPQYLLHQSNLHAQQGGGGAGAVRNLTEGENPEYRDVEPLVASHGISADCCLLASEPENGSELAEREFLEGQAVPPKAGDQHRGSRLPLHLSLCLIGLLAPLTAYAIWHFGRVKVGERRDNVITGAITGVMSLGKGKGKEGPVAVREDDQELRCTVSVIQAMAREARVTEANEAAERDVISQPVSDIIDDVDQVSHIMRKRIRSIRLDGSGNGNIRQNAEAKTSEGKKSRFLKGAGRGTSAAMCRTPPKGFAGSKKYPARSKANNADDCFRESPELFVKRNHGDYASDNPLEEITSSKDPAGLELENSEFLDAQILRINERSEAN